MQGNPEEGRIEFNGDQIQMMQDIRHYKKEEGQWPSETDFKDWPKTDYPTSTVEYNFGSWNRAKELAGGETDPATHGRTYSSDEIESVIEELCEREIRYKIQGEERFSERGEAVPIRHFGALSKQIEIDVPSGFIAKIKLNVSYPEFVKEKGYDHPNPDSVKEIDWDFVEEKLIEDIKNKVRFRGFEGKTFSPGEKPDWDYINSQDYYPSETSMRQQFGPMENWNKELGIEEENTADDVDVDLADLGMDKDIPEN